MKSLRDDKMGKRRSKMTLALLIGRLSNDLQSLNISWNTIGGRPIRTPRQELEDG